MVMLNQPRQSSLILTRNGVMDNSWPAIRDPFPDGSTIEIRAYDSSGNVIATLTGDVEPLKLTFMVPPEDLADIPNGAQYELILTTPDGPYVMEYGHVIRREATFFNPGPNTLEEESRLFTDMLGRDAIGRRWINVQGRVVMFDLGGGQWGMGPNIGALFAQAAVKYFRPLGGDSFRAKFSVYSTNAALGAGGSGKMRFHASQDSAMSTGIALEIETGVTIDGRELHLAEVTGPSQVVYIGSAVSQLVDTNDYFVVQYSDITKRLQVWLNDEGTGTPKIDYTDTDNRFIHGPGYRYFGFSWDSSLAATGALLLNVEMQDYV